MVALLVALLVALDAPKVAVASDHVDGPITTDHPIADLTDLYAFPTPDRPGYLSVILGVYPLVRSSGHFSEQVRYDILLRPARARTTGQARSFETAGDYAIECSFETPHRPFAAHKVRCQSSAGAIALADVDDISDPVPGERLRVFAGRRSDPFFINTAWFAALGERGVLEEPQGRNGLQHANVLALALEINVGAEGLDGGGGLVAVAAQAMTTDRRSGALRRLDRLGRPELANILLAPRGAADLRPMYNADEPFADESSGRPAYREQLRASIDWYDAADGARQWPTADRDALAELLLDDYLVVDVHRECSRSRAPTFAIERAMLEGVEELGCGGRSLDDDIIDDLYTLLVNRGEGPRIRDGVDRATQPPSPVFPYLAPPNEGALPAILGFVQRNGARVQSSGKARWRGLMTFATAILTLLAALIALIHALRVGISAARSRGLSRRARARSLGLISLLLGLAGVSVILSGSTSIRAPTLFIIGSAIALGLRRRSLAPPHSRH